MEASARVEEAAALEEGGRALPFAHRRRLPRGEFLQKGGAPGRDAGCRMRAGPPVSSQIPALTAAVRVCRLHLCAERISVSLMVPTAGHGLGEMLLRPRLSLGAELFLRKGRRVGVESCDVLSALSGRAIFSSNLSSLPSPSQF